MPPPNSHNSDAPSVAAESMDPRLHLITLKRMLAQQQRLADIMTGIAGGSRAIAIPQSLPNVARARTLAFFHVDELDFNSAPGRFAGWAFEPDWDLLACRAYLYFEGVPDLFMPLVRQRRPDVAAAFREDARLREKRCNRALSESGWVVQFSTSVFSGPAHRAHLCLLHKGETAAAWVRDVKNPAVPASIVS